MENIELWPLSQGEIDHRDERFEAVRRVPGRRNRFFESYITDLIDRDVVQISDIQHRDVLRRLLAAPIDSLWHS